MFADVGPHPGLALWSAAILVAVSFLVRVLGGLIGLALDTIRLPAK